MAETAKHLKTGSEGITWDLSDLYSGFGDKRIERDLSALITKSRAYEKKYRGKINSRSVTAATILKATKELEELSELSGRLLSFAYLVFAADTGNPEHGAFLQKIQEKATEARKHLLFFELELVAIPETKMKKLLADKKLEHYRHFLEQERRYKPHRLTEPEEKILDEKANTGSRAFKRLFDEVLNNVRFSVKLKGKVKDLSETETLALLYDPDREKRKAGAEGLTLNLVALTDSTSQTIAQIIQASLGEAGITVEIQPTEEAAYWALGDKTAGDDYLSLELVLQSFAGGVDPTENLVWFRPDQIGVYNWAFFDSAEYEELYQKSLTERDADKRRAMFNRMEDLMEESGSFVFICFEPLVAIHDSDLKPVILADGHPDPVRFARM